MREDMRRTAPWIAAALATALACAGPPPSRLDRLYQGLDESLPRIEPTILEGRSVLIDPGHGGFFRGTVGRDSLEETSVNLGVSLYLWGLLREAGADVHLTRAIDRDFLGEADSSLAADLQARVDIADSLTPDVFVSIHHNAQPERDPERNTVETYYKAGDPASLDLAFAVHRHLMRNLGIEAGEVRQGNYYVLRNVDAPAILGESSYLTHPNVEKKLALSDKQRLEAEAYFLGILDYLSRGVPRVQALEPTPPAAGEPPTARYEISDGGGRGIDPESVTLFVDGRAVEPFVAPAVERAGATVAYTFAPDVPNGTHVLELSARNLGGNTSAAFADTVLVEHPAAMAAFDPMPAAVPRGGGALRMRVRVLDRRGLPVADGTPIAALAGRDTTQGAVSGGVFDFPVRHAGSAALSVRVVCGEATFTWKAPAEPTQTAARAVVTVIDSRTGMPVRTDAVGAGQGFDAARGIAYVTPGRVALAARGFVPGNFDGVSDGDTLRLDPWFGGVLHGRRFVLDPAGGRAAGPLGLSAAWVNLRVARYLRAFLYDAGADVRLTRETEAERVPEDIARLTNGYRADRYLEIRHPVEPPESALAVKTYHFPGSSAGARLAADLAGAAARRLGAPPRPVASLVTYPLQQTACPAGVIAFPSLGQREEELRLDAPAYLREQAYAVFLGLLAHFACPDSAVLEVRVDHASAAGWLVTVDDTWTLVTGDDGRVRFENLPEGPRRVRAVRGTRRTEGEAVWLSGAAPVRLVVAPPAD